MTANSRDRLHPMPISAALDRHWRGHDLIGVASAVQQSAGWDGMLLPYTRVDGRSVFPVVTVDVEAVEQRLRRGAGPILDRARLRDLAADGFAGAPPRALVLAGYVVVEPFSLARRHLAALRTWAPTVLTVPAWTPLAGIDAAECDYLGYQVWVSDGRRASQIELSATRRPVPLGEVDAWQRLRDEQMFDLALVTGAIGQVAARLSVSS